MSGAIAYQDISYPSQFGGGIRGVVVSTKSGHELYSQGVKNSCLVSGINSAITSFAQELLGNYIQVVETDDMKVAYSVDNEKIVMLLTDGDVPNCLAKEMADTVSKRFGDKYDLSKFRGNMSTYNNFSEELEMMMYG